MAYFFDNLDDIETDDEMYAKYGDDFGAGEDNYDEFDESDEEDPALRLHPALSDLSDDEEDEPLPYQYPTLSQYPQGVTEAQFLPVLPAKVTDYAPILPGKRAPSNSPAPSTSIAPPPKSQRHTVGTRMLLLTRVNDKMHRHRILKETRMSKTAYYDLLHKAKERGWTEGTLVEPYHVEDRTRSGRPKLSERIEKRIIEVMTWDKESRGWSCARIASEVVKHSVPPIPRLSPSSVYRVLVKHGYGVYKPTVKPGLTARMRKERLEWCLAHAHWTLEDWKKVIWTDETSVQLGGRRGKRRIWRTVEERDHLDCIVYRYKGFKEFMWWSCFSYDRKGPYHIWETQTATEKATMEEDLAQRNKDCFEKHKREWELADGMQRIHITRNHPGRRAVFKHTERTGAYVVKEGTGGINWYTYQMSVLKPKLLPFAQECMEDRPNTVVQEDNAAAHASAYQQEVFDTAMVERLDWCANSPDLNPIEPTWFHMKRETTKDGPITSIKELREVWIKCWEDMAQEKIRAWIERVPIHIQDVIKAQGGNNYTEGRKKGQNKTRIH